MSKKVTLYSIFVASPGDTQEERSRIQTIVDELNVTLQQRGIKLDLLKWETHTIPGISDDPQAVINEQLPDDYDIFVGIMWHRYGTQTGRAESGTIEEFEKAKKRYDKNSSSVKIMFYFKEAPVSPYEIDPEQLKKVHAFRGSLGEKQGVLYQKFNDVDEFEKLLRIQISLQINELEQETPPPPPEEPDPATDEVVTDLNDENEDMGLMELQESFEEKFEELNDITKRIAGHIEELGDNISKRNDELNQLIDKYGGNPNRNEVKRLLNKTSEDMDEFVDQMKEELPIFGSSFDEGMDAFIWAVQMSNEFKLDSPDELRKALEAINTLQETSLEAEKQMQLLHLSITDLPPLISKLKKSRRAASEVIDQLIGKFRGVQNLTQEAERIIGNALQN